MPRQDDPSRPCQFAQFAIAFHDIGIVGEDGEDVFIIHMRGEMHGITGQHHRALWPRDPHHLQPA